MKKETKIRFTIFIIILINIIVLNFLVFDEVAHSPDGEKEEIKELQSTLKEVLESNDEEITKDDLMEINKKLNEKDEQMQNLQEKIEQIDVFFDDFNINVFEITHYAPHDKSGSGICHDGDPTTTASGTYPTTGRTIAVDPNVIPMGTEVYIEGYGKRIAEDTGGAINGHIIDVMIDSFDEAQRLGRQDRLVIYPS